MCLDLARATVDAGADIERWVSITAALCDLGTVARLDGRVEEATAFLTESLVLCQNEGDVRGAASALEGLGAVACLQGGDACGAGAEELALFCGLGGTHKVMIALYNLAVFSERRGDEDEATALLEEGIGLCRELGDKSRSPMRRS